MHLYPIGKLLVVVQEDGSGSIPYTLERDRVTVVDSAGDGRGKIGVAFWGIGSI
jgi:hypothetical protein